MKRTGANSLILILSLTAAITMSTTAAPVMFASRPNEVFKLQDLNGDDDYLDPFESIVFAEDLSGDGNRIVGIDDRIWLPTVNPATILLIEDRNGDGDALDPTELLTFAVLTADPPLPAPAPTAIARLATGAMLVTDGVNGSVIVVRDCNGDGDAFDFAETLTVADGLTQPVALAVRLDGVVLVAQNDSTVPVRILNDRNGDGDYLDFAENLSFMEDDSPGADLATASTTLSFLTRPAQGTVIKLIDSNGDDDVLDVNERLLFADNLTAPTVIARDVSNGDLYVSLDDANGIITRLRDANSDGDALDVNEALTVATGITDVRGLLIPQLSDPCQLGDADGDGSVNTTDVVIFARQLVGLPTATPVCSIDMNADGTLDGRDVQPFVAALLP